MCVRALLAAPLIVLCLAAITASGTATAETCGDVDTPCSVALGSFHVAAPPMADGDPARPAVIYLHGGGSSGTAMMRNSGMVNAMVGRGYVVIAPNGVVRPGRSGGSWSFGDFRAPMRDEAAFMRQIIDHAVDAFAVDRDRVLLTGFSIGGSMAWYLACRAPDDFAAYAPIAGGFWRPHPTDCAGPIKMLHTHGWTDQTVPLEGRPLREGVEQGDIHEGLQLWRRENGCTRLRADEFDTSGPFWRRVWTTCDNGTALEFALHDGGHGIPPGWTNMALDWFEAVVQ